MSNKINVPQKYLDEFQKILNELESETGLMYQIAINEFGKPMLDDKIIVGNFMERKKRIEVFEAKSDYNELLGTYDSKSDIEARIHKLKCDKFFSETKEIDWGNGKMEVGKCRRCGKYENKQGTPNPTKGDCCQNCGASFTLTKWYRISVSERDGKIDKIIGRCGPYNEIEMIAEYRFVN